MKIAPEGPDPLVVAIENAQRAVESFGRYLDAAQALEDYIASLIAGPCPCTNEAVCTGTIGPGVNIRDIPTVNGLLVFATTEAIEVSVFARTTYDQSVENHWYLIEYQGQSGWTARIDVSDECKNQLAANEVDLATALASGAGSTSSGTIDPGSIPLGTLEHAVCEGTVSGNLRSGPSTSASGVDLGYTGIPAHFFTKTHTEGELETGSNNQRVWYFVKINPFDLPGYPSPQYGWSASDVTSPPCAAQLPEVSSDFNPTVGTMPVDCSAIPPTGCVEIRDVATLFGGSKVRTHPSAPTQQQSMYGREVGQLRERTRFRYTAVQPDVDGCWYRISDPANNSEFWVKDYSDGIQYLSVVPEGECNEARYFETSDIRLGEPVTLMREECRATNYTYPYPSTSNASEKVAFVLNCESGGHLASAENIANVILNQMIVTGRSAVEIVESGAWQCVCGSDTPTHGSDFGNIQQLADQLVRRDTGNAVNIEPLEGTGGNQTRALYTVGTYFPEFDPDKLNNGNEVERESYIGEILRSVYNCYRYDSQCDMSACLQLHPESTSINNLRRIFTGADSAPGSQYVTCYFTNWPVAAICASFG